LKFCTFLHKEFCKMFKIVLHFGCTPLQGSGAAMRFSKVPK
jgi:hypothetical protein